MNEEGDGGSGAELALALCLYAVGIVGICIVASLFAKYYNLVF
jgi:hypothetical protein